MSNVSIEVKGLEPIIKKLGLGAVPIIKALTRGVGEEIRHEMEKQPGAVHLPFVWASRKQRAYVMAKRRGLGPYKRESDSQSERMLASWATENIGTHDARTWSKAEKYAKYVVSKQHQQPGHKATGWVTDEEAGRKVEQSGVAERLLNDITSKW